MEFCLAAFIGLYIIIIAISVQRPLAFKIFGLKGGFCLTFDLKSIV